MKYVITALRKKAIPYVDKKTGQPKTFTKIEVKTDKTGDAIYELGDGHSLAVKNTLKVGDMVAGSVQQVPWLKKDGSSGGVNNKLNGITVEYVYQLILKINPMIEEELPQDPKNEDELEQAFPDGDAEDNGEIPF